MLATRTSLFTRRSVRSLMFEGYTDTLLTVGSFFTPADPAGIPMDRFGWFYKRNGTTWSDGRVGPKNGVFLEILQYPGHNGNWQ